MITHTSLTNDTDAAILGQESLEEPYGLPPLLTVLFWLPCLTALLAILMLVALPLVCWRSSWLLAGRAGYTLAELLEPAAD